MSDDNNDKLMTAFIEKATPKLLEAMQEQITKHVEEQIGGLKEASQKMLDEIKDSKRAAAEAAAKEKAENDQFKALLERGDSGRQIADAMNPDPIKLTRTQARDPSLYRRAKAAAERQGTTVQIVAED